MTKLYFCPTFHPAGERNLQLLSKDYDIFYYNYAKNERGFFSGLDYPYVDLSLSKIVLRRFDFAITNTLAIACLVFKKRPTEIVTEDYLFALPYIVAAKFTGAKLVYYNSNSGPSSTRVRNKLIHAVKSFILRRFDEYWHGFDGADDYIAQYVDAESKLVTWVKLDRREVKNVKSDILSGIYVGEFSKRKRIQYVLNMECDASRDRPEHLNYKLIGAAPESSYFEERFKRQDHATALDHMQQSHFLCLLSEREAMGAVVFEALSCGAFVVLSQEIGANKIVRMMASEDDLPQGIVHYNVLGCIVDTSGITPSELNAFLLTHAKTIKSHRNVRAKAVESYLV